MPNNVDKKNPNKMKSTIPVASERTWGRNTTFKLSIVGHF
jgi:hypothetical protein